VSAPEGLGRTLTTIAAPLGLLWLSQVVVTRAAWAGVAALVAHFWHHVPKAQLRNMSDLLEVSQAAVVVVALDGTAGLAALLPDDPRTISSAQITWNFEAEYLAAVEGFGIEEPAISR
jgi:hypothetical protein